MSTLISRCVSAAAAAIAIFMATAVQARAGDLNKVVAFDIEAQPLETALLEYSKQADIQVVLNSEMGGIEARVLKGNVPAGEGLKELLKGTGYQFSRVGDGTVSVIRDGNPLPDGLRLAQAGPVDNSEKEGEAVEEGGSQLESVIVTGTRIKGRELTSPIVTISRDDMRISGHSTLGDVLRAMPQNFSGGQNPGVTDARTGEQTNDNVTSGSSFNLRGLGAGATLTLLNGQRLVHDGPFQAIDVGAIPVAAVDRVDVLLDGASAIYGSDAVGGVVNVILRRDYSGAELSARLGAATSGGDTQNQYTGVAGTTWDTGGVIVTADFSRNTSVSARQRDYLAGLNPDRDVYPNINQKSAVLSGHQKFGDSSELAIDGFYSDRDAHSDGFTDITRSVDANRSTSWGINPSLSFSLQHDMSLKLNAAFGKNKSGNGSDYFSISSGEQTGFGAESYESKNTMVGLEFGGMLGNLSAGSVGYSVGGGYKKDVFTYINRGAILSDGANQSRYAYGEIDVPLVSPDQSIPFVRQLSINGAARYEKYDRFGGNTTPKIGMFWQVVPSLDIKASWGRSFKAPSPLQQYQERLIYYYPASYFAGGPDAAEGRTALLTWGGNLDLKPEEAKIFTAGIVFKPESLAGMRLELNWFDIDYFDRVVNPQRNFQTALIDPTSADYTIINPSIEEINNEYESVGRIPGDVTANENYGNPDFSPRPFDPADVYAIVRDHYVNAARSRVRGIDLSASYSIDVSRGMLTLAGAGSWITDATRMLNDRSAKSPSAGLVSTQPKFRGRLNAIWSLDAYSVSAAVNYIDGVLNDLIAIPVKGKSMTTADIVLDYRGKSIRLGEFGINLAVTNISNQRPPYLEQLLSYAVPYDSTNYSALGRVVSFSVNKKF